MKIAPIARTVFSTLFLFVLLCGCATQPKIDWKARIGNYTYDQAVVDLGVPDKYTKLTDNTIVAEWVVARYSPDYFTFGTGGGFWNPWWAGPQASWAYPVGPSYNRWLRLVFSPDGKLRDWKKYER